MGGHVRGAGTLPAQTTRFIGRRRELSQARTLLSRGRLVTLTGPGGIGKTRLALQLAADVRRSFPDGVWLVELAALQDGQELAQTVAVRLRLGIEGISDPLPRLVEHVAGRRMLLVLDNCEHVLDASAALVATLLAASPELQVLSTSRQALTVSGEHIFPVPPMTLSSSAVPAEQSEAVTLFADRAGAVRPDYALTSENAAVAEDICRRLDGVPLAIELAAAQMRALSAPQILMRLDDRFRLLSVGPRSALPRQRTLRAAIDWSYDLCTHEERLLWARLSVLSGGFDLEAAEQICSGDGIDQHDVLGLITSLVDKSVLTCAEHGTRMRYGLLDTLRQYGREQLAASGEEHTLRERHRDYYRRVAEQAENEWFGPDQMAWFTRLHIEHSNLHAALTFTVNEPGHAQVAIGLAASLWSHPLGFLGFGSFNEGRRWLDRALALDDEPSALRAKALFVDGLLAVFQGDIRSARARLQECQAMAAAGGEHPDLSRATVTLAGLVALFQADFPRAIVMLDEAFTRHEAAGDAGSAAITACMLTSACVNLDDPAATLHAERFLALCEAHGAAWSSTHAQWAMGLDLYRRGLHQQAATLVQGGLRDKPLPYDQCGVAQCLEVLGWCAVAAGRDERAAMLMGAADAAWQVAGSMLTGLGHLQTGHQRVEAHLRKEMDAAVFAAATQAGRALTLEQAVAYALQDASVADAPPPVQEASSPLTRREGQVADLVAEGMTNKEIAARLTISRRTAEGHVDHILTKMGFTSRAQIAAWATRNQTS
ncbi:LuxR C-terminal-related transcriptional regulator [Streptomyces sp. NBC_00885]|uniref:ATP-binding protein n=1 Tax=Streptomyces sp. NBC_00885 TaxID=2975857 RepID=UPI00386D44C3|nr:LuxR C-terminal-related transcriptional regulator [Streptomyces sp. NBC_00885]